MPLDTIAEGDKYSRTQLLQGIAETIIDESPMFAFLPFMTVLGNSVTYLRESVLPTVDSHAPGGTWAESTPTVVSITQALKIFGGDADVDAFIARTRSNENDVRAEVIAQKAKALARKIENELVYGDDAADPNSFDGLHAILGDVAATPIAQDIIAGSGTAGGAGSFTKLDQLIDVVRGGPPACLMMHRRTRNQIRTLARAQGWDLTLSTPGGLANPIQTYNGIPIVINDFITITEDVANGGFLDKAGDDTTSIFAIRFGEDGVFGMDTGAGIEVEDVGALETKDATRTRVKWYMALAARSLLSIGRMSGIDDQVWVN